MRKVLVVITILFGAFGINAQQAELNRDNSAAISFLPYNGNSAFHISHGLDNKLYFSNGGAVGGVKMMTIVNTGYVGIGTTIPRSHLDVDGTIYWKTSKLTADQGGSISLRGSGTTPYIDFSNDLSTSYDARFMLTGNDKLYLAGANLGVGISNPVSSLHVRGTALGTSVNSASVLSTIEGSVGNISKLKVLNRRSENGTSWNKTSLRLQRVIDNVPQAFIDFGIENKQYNYGLAFGTGNKPQTRMVINDGGYVGIGTTNPDEKLTVKGKIHAEEILVDLQVPPDYVFQKYYTGVSHLKEEYTLPSLEEVEAFTKKNHHLPAIPSAKEIQKEGMQLKQMTTLLLQKVEELTLYTIEQEKRIKALEKELAKKK